MYHTFGAENSNYSTSIMIIIFMTGSFPKEKFLNLTETLRLSKFLGDTYDYYKYLYMLHSGRKILIRR